MGTALFWCAYHWRNIYQSQPLDLLWNCLDNMAAVNSITIWLKMCCLCPDQQLVVMIYIDTSMCSSCPYWHYKGKFELIWQKIISANRIKGCHGEQILWEKKIASCEWGARSHRNVMKNIGLFSTLSAIFAKWVGKMLMHWDFVVANWLPWSHKNQFGNFCFHFNLILFCFNSLWPSDAIWPYRYWSTLAQVMACCLMAPSHYLNQCRLIISNIQLSDGNFTRDTSVIND